MKKCRKLIPSVIAICMMLALCPMSVYAKKPSASQKSIKNAAVVLSSTTLTYNAAIQKPLIQTIGGMTLTEGTDYTVEWQDASSMNVGSYKLTINGIGNYTGKTRASYEIKPKAIIPSVTLSKKVFVFNGKEQKPAVAVKDGTVTLAATDYTITYAPECINVGSCKVNVQMKGNYTGSKTVKYKIIPKGTSVKSLVRASKAFTVKWTKQSQLMSASRITGYQIQLALNSRFSKGRKNVVIKGYSKVSRKITKLKGGKKYFVRIRTYKVVNGVKYYSKWSKIKTVTTKK